MQEVVQTKTILCPLSQVDEEDVLCAQGSCSAFDQLTNDCLYITVIQKFADPTQDNNSSDSLLSHGFNFMAIYKKHHKRIYNIAYQMLKNKEDAEDIAQETFVRAFKNISSIDPSVPVYAWLCRVATNLSIDRIRRAKGHQVTDMDACLNADSVRQRVTHFIQSMDVAYNFELNEHMALVNKVMDQLPPRYCQVLMLRVCEERSSREVAQILDISPTAVDTLLFRAKKRFKAIYRQIAFPS